MNFRLITAIRLPFNAAIWSSNRRASENSSQSPYSNINRFKALWVNMILGSTNVGIRTNLRQSNRLYFQVLSEAGRHIWCNNMLRLSNHQADYWSNTAKTAQQIWQKLFIAIWQPTRRELFNLDCGSGGGVCRLQRCSC